MKVMEKEILTGKSLNTRFKIVETPKNIVFNNPQGEQIGEFIFKDEQWHFKGKMAESAKVFIKFLQETFDLTKPQKDFLTWYTTGNNKHYSGDKLIEKYKKEVFNQ